jgi:hypothetical protein
MQLNLETMDESLVRLGPTVKELSALERFEVTLIMLQAARRLIIS